MFTWLALGLSIITGAICLLFWPKKVHWVELLIPFAVSFSLIMGAKSCAVHSLTWDEEWLGGYVIAAEYYEDWDEWIKKTCSYTTCSGSGKSRSCHTHYYDCSYRKYHPEHWVARTTLGSFSISKEEYERLCKKFNSPSIFQDMHRHYYTDDGDMFHTDWRGEVATVEAVADNEHYENKPQASLNVFKYQPVDTADIKRYHLYDYTPLINNKQKTYLGLTTPNDSAYQALDYFNATRGKTKQIRLWLLVFENQPREAGIAQENYWAGGNKNELVVCVGKQGNKVTWSHVFCWSDIKEVEVYTRHEIESLSRFDAVKLVEISTRNADQWWKRKSFHDFDYLTIEPTPSQTFWIFFWSLVACLATGIFIVVNPLDKDSEL